MKKKDKICPQCKKSYPPTRSDQVYCDDTCRWNAWRERKAKGVLSGIPNKNKPEGAGSEKSNHQPDIDITSTLRGVINGDGSVPEESLLSQHSSTHPPGEDFINASGFDPAMEEKIKDATSRKSEAQTAIKRVLEEIKSCVSETSKLKKLSEKYKQKEEEKALFSDDEYGMNFPASQTNYPKPSDWTGDEFSDEELYTPKELEAMRQEKLAGLETKKTGLEQKAEELKKQMEEASHILNGIERACKKQKGRTILSLLEGIKNNKMQQQFQTNQNDVKPNKSQTRKRVMNLREIKQMKYQYLNFQNRWNDFIGQPSVHFHLAVHGLPGQGKSTFCILLAEYLAENFGEVMYISGEQGFEKTLQDIINRTGANSDKMDFSDPKCYEEIYTCVEKKYNFIFIDSLNTLRIDSKGLKKLKEYYSQSAFITISQSTKDGKMKGDNEILHDADTIIGVEKGMASTSKNRFNPSDRQFAIFGDNQ